MPFTTRRIRSWDDPGLRDLNMMMDELARFLGQNTASVAAGQPGVQVTDKFVSDYFPAVTISATSGVPNKVRHGLGVKPSFVTITPLDSNTGQVYLDREPDDVYIYLMVTSSTRKVWIKAEV